MNSKPIELVLVVTAVLIVIFAPHSKQGINLLVMSALMAIAALVLQNIRNGR